MISIILHVRLKINRTVCQNLINKRNIKISEIIKQNIKNKGKNEQIMFFSTN